jgi:hypothetical protein
MDEIKIENRICCSCPFSLLVTHLVEDGLHILQHGDCNIQKKCCQRLIFDAWMWKKDCGPLDAKLESSVAPFCFSPKETLVVSLCPFLAAPPPSPPTLSPLGSRPLPSPRLPPPSRSPPCSKNREEEEHVELKRKRGSRRCSSPSLLAGFLGETLGMDEILVPPCNYVLLEVVDHGN